MVLKKHHVRRYTDNASTYESEDNLAASSVTIRIDGEIKEGASRIAEHFGFDLSSVTRAFYMQMIRENRIPLNLSDPEPNEESLEAIRETEEMIHSGTGQSYATAHDLIQAALA